MWVFFWKTAFFTTCFSSEYFSIIKSTKSSGRVFSRLSWTPTCFVRAVSAYDGLFLFFFYCLLSTRQFNYSPCQQKYYQNRVNKYNKLRYTNENIIKNSLVMGSTRRERSNKKLSHLLNCFFLSRAWGKYIWHVSKLYENIVYLALSRPSIFFRNFPLKREMMK